MGENHRTNNIKKVEYLRNISENIKRLRNRLGLTHNELADKAGVSRSTIQTFEKGKEETLRITVRNLFKIVEALAIEPGDLFLTGKGREDITYKTKILFDKFSKMFELEEKKQEKE
jgi:transcriptional regulator with XRE-family HTH domain